MIKSLLFFVLLLVANGAFAQHKSIELPFRNLAYPIDSVTSCITYAQRIDERHIYCIAMIVDDITFYTNTSTTVHPVIDGLVVSVAKLSDINCLVIVKHGKFFFTYSGLSETNVKKGDSVCLYDVLGRTGIDEENGMYSVAIQLDTKEGAWDPEPIFSYQDKVPIKVISNSSQDYLSAIKRFKL